MAKEKKSVAPPDQAERDLITRELDKTMLVEAAAGTGKTTAMIGRMVALLGQREMPHRHLGRRDLHP